METRDDLGRPKLFNAHVQFFNQRLFFDDQIFAANLVNSEQGEVVGIEQCLNNLLEKAKNGATALLVHQRDEAFAMRHLKNALSLEKANAFHHNARVHIVGEQVFVS